MLGPYSPVAAPTEVVPVVYKVQDQPGAVKTGGVVEDAEEGVRMKSIVNEFGLGSNRYVCLDFAFSLRGGGGIVGCVPRYCGFTIGCLLFKEVMDRVRCSVGAGRGSRDDCY